MFSVSHQRHTQAPLLTLLLGKIFYKQQCLQINKKVLINKRCTIYVLGLVKGTKYSQGFVIGGETLPPVHCLNSLQPVEKCLLWSPNMSM